MARSRGGSAASLTSATPDPARTPPIRLCFVRAQAAPSSSAHDAGASSSQLQASHSQQTRLTSPLASHLSTGADSGHPKVAASDALAAALAKGGGGAHKPEAKGVSLPQHEAIFDTDALQASDIQQLRVSQAHAYLPSFTHTPCGTQDSPACHPTYRTLPARHRVVAGAARELEGRSAYRVIRSRDHLAHRFKPK